MPRARRKTATQKSTSARATTKKTTSKKTTSKKATSRKAAAARHPAARTKTPGAISSARAGSFRCPECGKRFSRAASLGAHRNRAHGVAGASSRTSATANTSTTTRSAASPRHEGSIDRDALLSALFPNGIPARERLIRELDKWLDQAERLANTK